MLSNFVEITNCFEMPFGLFLSTEYKLGASTCPRCWRWRSPVRSGSQRRRRRAGPHARSPRIRCSTRIALAYSWKTRCYSLDLYHRASTSQSCRITPRLRRRAPDAPRTNRARPSLPLYSLCPGLERRAPAGPGVDLRGLDEGSPDVLVGDLLRAVNLGVAVWYARNHAPLKTFEKHANTAHWTISQIPVKASLFAV